MASAIRYHFGDIGIYFGGVRALENLKQHTRLGVGGANKKRVSRARLGSGLIS